VAAVTQIDGSLTMPPMSPMSAGAAVGTVGRPSVLGNPIRWGARHPYL
jgi:hypothetical protein